MRIFHIITLSSLGGAQSVVVNLANEQVKTDEVFVVSSAHGEAWRALDSRVKVIKIKSLHREISLKDICVLFRLIWLKIKYRPDVVHLHSSKMGALGRIAFRPKKTIYTVHGFDTIRIANRKFLKIEQILQKRCAKIVGVAQYDVIAMKSEGIVNNVTYVYNGIRDLKEQQIGSVDNEFKHRLEVLRKQYDKIVLSIARDDKQKRIDLFIDVASLNPKVCFVWIGNKNIYQVSDNVVLMGMVPLASQLMQYADIFILPSNYEGLPMSIIEALSSGKPVVASNVGGVSELLDGNNGFAVKNDPEAMSEKIRYILADDKRYQNMAISARKTYEAKFTVAHMVNSYKEIYESIITI